LDIAKQVIFSKPIVLRESLGAQPVDAPIASVVEHAQRQHISVLGAFTHAYAASRVV
jgi:hypothetical protein